MTASILRDLGRTSASAPAARLTAAERADAIDLVHLSRQTLGDRALEIELLRLFERQCGRILGKLQKAGAAGERREGRDLQDLVHTLKGSARAVGAGAVADAAERYEFELGRPDQGDGAAQTARAALSEAAEEARRQAAKLVAED